MLTFRRILSRTIMLAAVVGAVGLTSDFVRGTEAVDIRTRQCTAIAAVVFLVAHLALRRRAWAVEGLFVGAFGGAVVADVLVIVRSWATPECMFLVFTGAAMGAVAASIWRGPDVVLDPRGPRVEELAEAAEAAAEAGDEAEARRIYAEAAALETAIAWSTSTKEPRIRGLLAVSAVALWRKAGNEAEACDLAARFIDAEPGFPDSMPPEFRDDLYAVVANTNRSGGQP